ncbi:hypothetical protein ACFL45_06120 [Candidatus Neomarinimicrobiota bacterium]
MVKPTLITISRNSNAVWMFAQPTPIDPMAQKQLDGCVDIKVILAYYDSYPGIVLPGNLLQTQIISERPYA